MNQPVLEARELTKIFTRRGRPALTAVDHVSFRLMPGECLGLIGESGSGKSTLAHLLTRLTEASGGSILLDGQNITHARGKSLRTAYRKMQMVFQMPADSFDPRQKLGRSIGESLRNAGAGREQTQKRVEELLTECGLTAEFAQRYPHEVSAGQCQRAAIARALAVEPSVLICDEATSALDVTVQEEILALLGELRRRRGTGLSILFICHDLALVQQFCDRVLVLHRGRIAEEGTPGEVIGSPKEESTRQLVSNAL